MKFVKLRVLKEILIENLEDRKKIAEIKLDAWKKSRYAEYLELKKEFEFYEKEYEKEQEILKNEIKSLGS